MSFRATFEHMDKIHSVTGSSFEESSRRCAMSFNPGKHEPTEKIKGFVAAAMESVIEQRDKVPPLGEGSSDAERKAHGDSMRCFATALTHLESAQMFAVKGLHTRANAGLDS